jgi:hypothetical protein
MIGTRQTISDRLARSSVAATSAIAIQACGMTEATRTHAARDIEHDTVAHVLVSSMVKNRELWPPGAI